MLTLKEGQWATSDWANIGKPCEVHDSKEEAMAYALRRSENQDDPFIHELPEQRIIEYRGRVYL